MSTALTLSPEVTRPNRRTANRTIPIVPCSSGQVAACQFFEHYFYYSDINLFSSKSAIILAFSGVCLTARPAVQAGALFSGKEPVSTDFATYCRRQHKTHSVKLITVPFSGWQLDIGQWYLCIPPDFPFIPLHVAHSLFLGFICFLEWKTRTVFQHIIKRLYWCFLWCKIRVFYSVNVNKWSGR
jgi:hypothetical protein